MISISAKQTKIINELKEENKKLKSKIISLKENESQNNNSNKSSCSLPSLGDIENVTGDKMLSILCNSLSEAEISIVITNLSGHIVFTNEAFLKLTGYKNEEVINQHTRVLKSGRHKPEFYINLWQTVLSGKIWNGQMINKKKDRTLFTEDLTIVPVKNSDGIVSYFIAVKKDIVPQKTEQMNSLLKKKTSPKLASEILEEVSKPIDFLNYNLCFLKDAFIDLHPILEHYENNLQESNSKELIDNSDFEFIKSEITTAIDESLNGLHKISNIEHKLVDIIRKAS